MGVEDPHELPPAYPKRGDDHEVSAKAVPVVSDAYISGDSGDQGTGTSQPWLTSSVVTREEWQTCVDFANQLN